MTGPMVGIVGAGQLARMTAQAAPRLGVETTVLAVDAHEPACGAATSVEIGDPSDPQALARLAKSCDVITFDHERVDPAAVELLERDGHLVRPGADVLRFADKAQQRRRLAAAGFPVPPFIVATSPEEVATFAESHGWPVVVKAATGGYDGRGVFVVADAAAARAIAAGLAGVAMVVEPLLDIEREVAVVVARRPSGDSIAYPLIDTIQVDGICVETVTPAAVPLCQATDAIALALRIADVVGAAGILAVEMFITGEGILINELAPRPHNSGHWTIEGAVTSQFENHLRGVLDWPLGEPSLTANAVAMANVLGTQDERAVVDGLHGALTVRGAHVHLYGKAHRPGRKLGHVTALGGDRNLALARARAAAAALHGDPIVSTPKEHCND